MSAIVAPGRQVGGPTGDAQVPPSRGARSSGRRRRGRITTWVLSALSVVLFAFFVFPV